MSDKKISELTASATPLAGTEVLPIVQSGVTKKVSVDNLTAGKTVNAANLVVTDDAAIGTVISTGTKLRLRTPQTGTAISADNSVNSGFVVKFAPNVTNIGNDFSQPLGFLVSDIQQAKLEATGNFTLNLGNLVIGTSGKGIDFSADGSAAGMTSELLDDYEEGTWTPVITATTSNPTIGYDTQSGTYTKVGRLVTCQIYVQFSTVSGGSGSLKISLPFATSSANQGASSINIYNIDTPYALLHGTPDSSAATLGLLSTQDNQTWAPLTVAYLKASATQAFSMTVSFTV